MPSLNSIVVGSAMLLAVMGAAAQISPNVKAEVVGHLGIVHVSGSKPIFGSNGDADGIMFKTNSLDSWKDVLFTANLEKDMPDDQRQTISNYQVPKTAYVTCKTVTVVRVAGKTTSLMAKGDNCSIDRLTTP